MKIGIIGSPNTPETKWIESEAKSRGHIVKKFKVSDFYFTTQNNKFSVISDYDFNSFDIFLVRGICRTYFVNDIPFNKSTESLLFLRYINDVLQKPIVDERLAKQPFILSKMATSVHLAMANLPQPNAFQFQKKDKIIENLDRFPYPVIVKNPAGRKGKNIFKLDTKNDLSEFLKSMPKTFPFVIQEYLPTDGDIRVIVIGYKAIGAMKRHVIEGDFRANISQGAKAEKYELNDKIKEIAEKAAKITKTEYAGVDLIKSKGKYYVIEVNRAPQFRGFKKYTNIDPSPFIIDYLEKKANTVS